MKSCQLPVYSFILETTARWMHISYRSDSHFMLHDYMKSDSGVSIIQLGYPSKGPCKTQNDEHFSDIFFLTFNRKFFKLFVFTGAIISFHRSILQISIDKDFALVPAGYWNNTSLLPPYCSVGAGATNTYPNPLNLQVIKLFWLAINVRTVQKAYILLITVIFKQHNYKTQ